MDVLAVAAAAAEVGVAVQVAVAAEVVAVADAAAEVAVAAAAAAWPTHALAQPKRGRRGVRIEPPISTEHSSVSIQQSLCRSATK